ncbi:uncharacterized protein LOC144916433, partial [Branchiostoma floridae x Branchiostoma belcheri]
RQTSVNMNIVTLNVGGHIYTTARSTLTRYPDSMLGAMFGGDLETLRDDQGRYFIDRDGTLFRHVLNFLRTSQLLVLPEGFKELDLLEMEAEFYQIEELIKALRIMMDKDRPEDHYYDDDVEMSRSSEVVTLDVGGHIYRTTMTTLTRYPDSMLGAMFGGDLETLRDDQGRYFIDRDGTLFRHVLNFLRTGQLVLPEDFKELPLLKMEADFYQIQPLIEALKTYKASMYQRCAHDFVVLKPHKYPQYTVVSANTKEVENKVKELVKALADQMSTEYAWDQVPNEVYMAALLGKFDEIGFDVQTCVVIGDTPTWFMVRKNCQGIGEKTGGRFELETHAAYIIAHFDPLDLSSYLVVPNIRLAYPGNEIITLFSSAAIRIWPPYCQALRFIKAELVELPVSQTRLKSCSEEIPIKMSGSNDIVTLDVGGHVYRTAMTTLTRYPDSMLGAMFGGDLGALRDDQGRYFIDRDGALFRHVLNFLRTGQMVLPEDFKELPLLEMEADFYQIQPLIEALKTYKANMYQRCAHEFVVVKPHKYPQFTVVSANTKEVENKVKELVKALADQMSTKYAWDQVPNEVYMAALLGKFDEIGFTVQTCVVIVDTPIWFMVRKTCKNS